MVMSPWRLSSRWLNLTTGSRAEASVCTLCTPGTHFFKIAATRSKISTGEAVDRSMSDRIESSERPSSDGFSPVCWKTPEIIRHFDSLRSQVNWRSTHLIGWLPTSLKDFGVLKVQKQIEVTGVDSKCVHRGAERHDNTICKTSQPGTEKVLFETCFSNSLVINLL